MARLRPQPGWRLIPIQFLRLTLGLALAAVPVSATFMTGIYFIGSALGKLGSLQGARSGLYARPDMS